MLESARQLSRVQQKAKKLKKPKKPKKLTLGIGRNPKSKGRGRGRRVIRGRKDKSVPQRRTDVKTSGRIKGRKEIMESPTSGSYHIREAQEGRGARGRFQGAGQKHGPGQRKEEGATTLDVVVGAVSVEVKVIGTEEAKGQIRE